MHTAGVRSLLRYPKVGVILLYLQGILQLVYLITWNLMLKIIWEIKY